MKNIWKYVSAILAGVIAGIVIAVKFLQVDKVVYQISKLKLKRSPGGQINATLNDQTLSEGEQRQSRLERKFERKQGKIIKRNQKKKLKAERRLENL